MFPVKATDKESGRPSKVTPVFTYLAEATLISARKPAASRLLRYAQSRSFYLFIFLKIVLLSFVWGLLLSLVLFAQTSCVILLGYPKINHFVT